MMPNITRAADPGAVMAYLVDCESPKNVNVHTHPHVVAGTVGLEYRGTLTHADAGHIASSLRVFQRANNVTVDAGHVWHCSLALKADEGAPGDQKWGLIAHDFMDRMGFDSTTRWVAVDHGTSRDGNSHVHLVASVVKANGRRVNTYRDMPKSQRVCSDLEVKYGLRVLQSRLAAVGAGSVPYTQAEALQAKQQHKPETDRVALERKVRVAAAASASEAEFVRRVRNAGLLLRPFPATDTAKVTGYSVGLKAPNGARQDCLAGGQLARDLTLPQLRRNWKTTPRDDDRAQAEWRKGTRTKPAVKTGRETHTVPLTPETVQVAQQELTAVGEQLEAITPEQLADLSHDISGALAAASAATETTPGELAKASRDVGAWAQSNRLGRRTAPREPQTKTAALLFAAAMDPLSPTGQSVLVRQLADTLAAVYRLHLASRQAATQGGRKHMTQVDDGLDEFVNEGLTVATVTGARLAEVHAQHKRRDIELGDAKIGRKEWEGMDDRQRSQVPEQAPQRTAGWEPWTAETIARDRHIAKAQKIAEQFRQRDARSTVDQQERVKDLANRLGLTGVEHAVPGISEKDANTLLRELELAADGLPVRLEEALKPSEGLSSKTGLGPINDTADADAFMDRLERHHEARVAESGPQVIDQVPIMQGNKDPRQWASAGEPPTQRMVESLKRSGFTAEEIALLNKGDAGYVIGYGRHGVEQARRAFENTQAMGIMAAPASPDTPNLSTTRRPAIDIRTGQKPPTQRL